MQYWDQMSIYTTYRGFLAPDDTSLNLALKHKCSLFFPFVEFKMKSTLLPIVEIEDVYNGMSRVLNECQSTKLKEI